MALNIRSNERVAFIGRTGSGKTFLAERLTAPLHRLIIIDPNDVLSARFQPHVSWQRGVKVLLAGEQARLRVVEPALYGEVFRTAYQARNVVVYIDEAYGVTPPGGKPDEWLWALYTRGRARGIGVWAATQRPRFIPRFMLSEAEWFFVFQLNLEDDRQYLAGMIHPTLRHKVPDAHGFYYWNIQWDKPRYTPRLKV